MKKSSLQVINRIDMKQFLLQLFSHYGKVLEVHIREQYRMRGQAFIVYDSKSEAENAQRLLQSYYFYGKSMVTPTQRISYSSNKSDTIAKRDGVFINRQENYSSQKREDFFNRLKLKNSLKRRVDLDNMNGHYNSNNVLFLERLESSVTEGFLENIFSLYLGFKEVRLIPEKGVAFVEFFEAKDASGALAGLNGFKVSPTCQFFITYAKRG